MGLLRFKCETCGKKVNILMGLGQNLPAPPTCPNEECGAYQSPMIRETGGSTSVMETRDNGAMPRKLERARDAEELRRDHAELSNPKKPVIL